MSAVTVEVSDKWVSRVQSAQFKLVQALTGVAITFAPILLYYTASTSQFAPGTKVAIVAVCFALIYFVPLFYIAFSRSILSQIPPHATPAR